MVSETIMENIDMAKTPEKQLKRIDEYKKKYVVNVALQFNTKTEPLLTEYVRSLPNKTAYIKGLIRADMERISAESKKEDQG